MKHLSILLFSFLLSTDLFAVEKDYDWGAPGDYVELNEEDAKEHSVYLSDVNKIIFYFNSKDVLVQRTVRHYKVRVNTSKGIEDYNRVYIPLSDAQLIDAKARVIQKNGAVVELNKSAMKEATEMENLGAFKYFAVEGVAEGSDIEILFITDRSPSINGIREYVQATSPVKLFVFELQSPKHLHWGFKTYNGLPEVQQDTTVKAHNRYVLNVSDLSPLYAEKYANQDINRQFLVYRLERNSANNVSNITSFVDVSSNVWRNINQPLSKNSLKKYATIIKEIKLKTGDVLGNVRKFENYIKHNFQISEENNPMFSSPDFLLENKIGDDGAFTKLMAYFLQEQGIPFELGITCDRSEYVFDRDFDAFYALKEFFIYLPDEDVYLAPGEFESRVGFLPMMWTHNQGLFIRPVSLGATVQGVGRVDFIPARSAADSRDILEVDLKLAEDFSSVLAKVRKEMTGYNAMIYQPVYGLIPAESKKALAEALAQVGGKEDKVTAIKVQNHEVEDILVKPFILEAEVESVNLIEKAGNRFIIKIGAVIGDQVEMFQERPRQQPIDLPYNHDYVKEIRLHIPDGYRVRNPDVLVHNIRYEHEGREVVGFVSTVKQEGNVLIVNVHEFYDVIKLPIEAYPVFESVINAAATFFETAVQLEKM